MNTKKFIRTTLAILLISIFLVSFTSLAYTVDENLEFSQNPDEIIFVEDFFDDLDFQEYIHTHLILEFGEQFMHNRNNSIAIADELLESFSTNSRSRTASSYPKDFGGMYIDDDGNLRILFVSNKYNENTSSFSRLSDVPGIYFEEVTYSQNELFQVFNEIYDFLGNNRNRVSQNINGMSVDIINNRVIVYLRDDSLQQEELFKNHVNSHSSIVFLHSSENDLDDTRLNPGSSIRRSSNGLTRSVGYRARLGNLTGFVTAAHGSPVLSVGELFNVGGSTVGRVMRISPATDSAFVDFSPSVTWANLSSHNVVPIVQNPIVGDIAIRISAGGSDSPHVSSGRITVLVHGHTGAFGTIQTVRATYSRSAGDSGGVIVRSIDGNRFGIFGIHIGNHGASGDATFSTARRINESMHLGTTAH